VRESLGEKIDLILDGGQSRIGVESTVLDISDDSIKILRPGGTPREAIFQITGIREQETETRITNEECKMTNRECGIRNEELEIVSQESKTKINSPGLLKSHYAPKARLFVMSKDEIIKQDCKIENSANQKTAFLFFDAETRDAWRYAQMPHDDIIVSVLSESGSMIEAASHLFEILHEFDNCGVSFIYAQEAPPHGLGEAINDRLKRGASV
jgi:L-threonylcarbamoyladenylate synthase